MGAYWRGPDGPPHDVRFQGCPGLPGATQGARGPRPGPLYDPGPMTRDRLGLFFFPFLLVETHCESNGEAPQTNRIMPSIC